jgi:hypothetical protein
MFLKKNKKQKIRQSTRHNLIGSFLFKNKNIKKSTQSTKRIKEDQIKAIIIDGTAYWIKDNVFYSSETIENVPNPETAKPVDIENMPKKELDKMLFILDNLNRGDTDEHSSSGNE